MATLTINIPDAVATEVIDTFATVYGWTVETGLTKAQFAKQKVAEYVKNVYRSHQVGTATATTAITVNGQIDLVDIN